ncbi:MAG: hypothetical protein PHG79_01545 [Methanosarcina sp.]|nr:hypothetical protein [Methanosarcina sp.]MDD3873014.1 hypothetical protein [Methanosarcina sp.]MDD4521813.1 hypothetical protein [Methanosarcina sp.]HHV24228.1 hypothetical protein [Methanosarcina sp.]
MVLPPLKERTFGYELSGSEHKLIFEKEDIGYVRYKNKAAGIFYLDPSPYYNDPRSQIYVIKSGTLPPKGQLIEVKVTETETFRSIDQDKIFTSVEEVLAWAAQAQNESHIINIKYVVDWDLVNPNKIRGNKLTSKDDFLEFISTPIKYNILGLEDLQYCLGMCAVSAPQITELEKGGVNAVVLDKKYDSMKWAAFKRIMSIVPKEFKQPTSKNFYKYLTTNEQPCPTASTEVNLSYFNVPDVPIHLPIPFDMKFKTLGEYKENFDHYLPLARAYMIDSLLFQPYIPEKIEKRMEEAMYFILDDISSTGIIPYYQDIGSVIPKLATSFARLNFDSWISLGDLNKSKGIWMDLMTEARHTIDSTRTRSTDQLYQLTPDAEKLLKELNELEDAGIPLLITTIKEKTSLMEWNFEDALKKLRICGYVYFPNNERIGLIHY